MRTEGRDYDALLAQDYGGWIGGEDKPPDPADSSLAGFGWMVTGGV